MGLSTLNGARVTSSRVFIPAWGCWHASVDVDGDVAIAPGARVTLVMADLALVGTVLTGGTALGRSFYRIVGGAGGWGKAVPAASYPDDSGTKFATILGDTAQAVGETMAPIAATVRTGPNWTREAGPASMALNTLAPAAWYVDQSGVTHLGARTPAPLPAKVTRLKPVDLARGKVELASESIATILPGVVIDGLTAVDVVHEISAEGGLRSTVYGGPNGSVAESVRKFLAALEPNRDFLAPSEYRVDVVSGNRLHLQPLRSHMPYLKLVPVRPGVSGCDAEIALGSFVVVQWLDGDPSRPFVSSFADVDADRFQPSELTLNAGGMAGGESVVTTKACALMIYNTLVAIMAAAPPGPLTSVIIQPLLGSSMTLALAAQAAPAPPGLVAQTASALAFQASFATGVTPSPATFAAWDAAFALLATKTANVSGAFPSLGCKAVKGG